MSRWCRVIYTSVRIVPSVYHIGDCGGRDELQNVCVVVMSYVGCAEVSKLQQRAVITER